MKRYTFFHHLRKVNMSYLDHMKHSMSLSKMYFEGGFKAFIHGVFPNMYETSSTDTQKKIHDKLFKKIS